MLTNVLTDSLLFITQARDAIASNKEIGSWKQWKNILESNSFDVRKTVFFDYTFKFGFVSRESPPKEN